MPMETAANVPSSSTETVSQPLFQTAKLKYTVIPVSNSNLISNKLAALISSHPMQNDADRGIIYCPTKTLAEEIFQYLKTIIGDTFALFTGALSTIDKGSILKSWRDGSVKWIIGTTAFGMGLDYPSVRYVFHAGQSYSMEDYHQETGRLSRDGKKGIAICITSPDFVNRHMQNCSDISSRRQLTDWIFDSRDCRRERLTKVFDERPTNCSEVDNEKCDVCDLSISPLEY